MKPGSEIARRTRRVAGVAACVLAALMATLWLASSTVQTAPFAAGDVAREGLPPVAIEPVPPAAATPPAAPTVAAQPVAPPAVGEPAAPVAAPGAAAAAALTQKSTLAAWKLASSSERSRVAVEIARKHLSEDATRLEIARIAMEITGCVTATAGDPRFGAWTVEPTAATCLSAPERPAP